MIKIAIIGGGPAGVSLGMQLKQQLCLAKIQKHIEIIIFEKSPYRGVGIPYQAREECHILNFPKEMMGLVPGDTQAFARWHKESFGSMSQTSFPPRYYFGAFLETRVANLQLEAEQEGLKVSYLTENEVFAIQKEQLSTFKITAARGEYLVDYVILSIGHLPSTLFDEWIGYEGYIHNPWNIKDYEKIQPNDSVTILGTRLTAIDAVLKLHTMNHEGKITMVSRGGLLPTVFGNNSTPYILKYFSEQTLQKLKHKNNNYLNLNDLFALFKKEFQKADESNLDLNSIPTSYKDISPLDWINNEISEAEHGANTLQRVLFALYPLTSTIWSMLSENDKAYFLNNYNSLLNNYLAAFPLESAYKIKDMLLSGFIEVLGNLTKVEFSKKQFHVYAGNDEIISSKYLINATGPGYEPDRVGLLTHMLEHSLISKHALGGIRVDSKTFHVIGGDEKINSHLFAIGELTKGTCFITSSLNVIVEQANKVVTTLLNQLVANRHYRDKVADYSF